MDDNGELELDKWLKTLSRAQQEEENEQSNASCARHVVAARYDDVLFGQGWPYQHHDANVRLNNVIRQQYDQYEAAPRFDKVLMSWAIISMVQKDWGGRFLVIGFAAGPIPKIPLNLPLLKGADLRGVFWGAFTMRDPVGNRKNIDQLLAWLADGSLKPHVDSVFPLEEGAAALEKIAAREVKGKVLLRVA